MFNIFGDDDHLIDALLQADHFEIEHNFGHLSNFGLKFQRDRKKQTIETDENIDFGTSGFEDPDVMDGPGIG